MSPLHLFWGKVIKSCQNDSAFMLDVTLGNFNDTSKS